MFRRLSIVFAIAVSATGLEAGANPVLVERCADGPGVGPFTLPFTTDPFAITAADFDLGAPSCSGQSGINDAVLCFAPENGCTLTINCDWSPGSLRGAGQYLSLFAGPCVDAPASCLAWAFDSSNTELSEITVAASQRYCVVCQDLAPGRVLTVSLTATAGDCGLIDVVLFADGFESGDTAAWSATAP